MPAPEGMPILTAVNIGKVSNNRYSPAPPSSRLVMKHQPICPRMKQLAEQWAIRLSDVIQFGIY
jgi:hypothetical protein